jgi:hypothetical protein
MFAGVSDGYERSMTTLPIIRARQRRGRARTGPPALPTGGGVGISSSAVRRAAGAGRCARDLLALPQMMTSSLARTSSAVRIRRECSCPIETAGAWRTVTGGGVTCSSGGTCSDGAACGARIALGNAAACLFARAITASQSSSSSAGGVGGHARTVTECGVAPRRASRARSACGWTAVDGARRPTDLNRVRRSMLSSHRGFAVRSPT